MAQNLDTMIRSFATTKIGGKYNFPQFKAEKETLLNRKAICEELVKISEDSGCPLSFLVYFAVSKQAHRPTNFEKEYVKFNKDKALAIIAMAKEFSAFHGMKKPNDKAYHGICAYYERCDADFDNFMVALKKMTPCKKFATAKDIYRLLGGK